MTFPLRNRSTSKAGRVSSRGSRQSDVGAKYSGLPIRLQRILLAVDFSECSRSALHYVAAFARQFNAALTLLHVAEPTPYERTVPEFRRELHDDAQVRLGTLAQEEIGRDIISECVVRFGSPWQEIVRHAAAIDAHVIVIGTHGRTGLKHVFLGSVAERVVREAPCPVLVVPESRHEPNPRTTVTPAKTRERH